MVEGSYDIGIDSVSVIIETDVGKYFFVTVRNNIFLVFLKFLVFLSWLSI